MFNIVLVHPEIPHNTGAAGRLALATGSTLHLIEPLGFSIDDATVRRVGLDYWKDVDLKVWPDWTSFLASVPDASRLALLSSHATQAHWEHPYQPGDYLVFGCESKGLPADIHQAFAEQRLTIPMPAAASGKSTRSLNLATAIAIVLYEGVRQTSS